MSVCSFMQIPNMVHISIQKMIQATGNMVAPMWSRLRAWPLILCSIHPDFWDRDFPSYGNPRRCGGYGRGLFIVHDSGICLAAGQKQKVRIKIKGFHLQKWADWPYFTLGLPSFIMNALSSFMVTFVNFFLVAYSDTAIRFLRCVF